MEKADHVQQQKVWDNEHKKPTVLLQMDSNDASSGVLKFWEFLEKQGAKNLKGLEMGCGKGRNVIWLAKQNVEMHGFDFSPAAIEEAKRRAKTASTKNAHFKVQDATETWAYESDSFDFVIDCFATTDIESATGREFSISEAHRVLKPDGYLFAYLLSTDDEFHKEMIQNNPAKEKNAFYHHTGKFEKTFDEQELQANYQQFRVVLWERVEKTAEFNGKSYYCKHFWLVLQK